MLGDDKVLVLVHKQQRAVGDLAGIVVHREAVGWALGGLKPAQVCQAGAHRVRQVLQ